MLGDLKAGVDPEGGLWGWQHPPLGPRKYRQYVSLIMKNLEIKLDSMFLMN